MSIIRGKISQFIKAIKDGLVSDIPVEYQACELCREPECDSNRAANCTERLIAEQQERKQRERTTYSPIK